MVGTTHRRRQAEEVHHRRLHAPQGRPPLLPAAGPRPDPARIAVPRREHAPGNAARRRRSVSAPLGGVGGDVEARPRRQRRLEPPHTSSGAMTVDAYWFRVLSPARTWSPTTYPPANRA